MVLYFDFHGLLRRLLPTLIPRLTLGLMVSTDLILGERGAGLLLSPTFDGESIEIIFYCRKRYEILKSTWSFPTSTTKKEGQAFEVMQPEPCGIWGADPFDLCELCHLSCTFNHLLMVHTTCNGSIVRVQFITLS